jgi:YbbR domain-containing protein
MARWLWDNLRTFMLALLLAILVWAVAVNEENPIQEKVFPQTVSVQLRNLGPDLMIMGNPSLQTSVTIRAPKLIWDTLTIDQIHVTADLNRVGAGTYAVPLTAVLDLPAARLTRLEPGSLNLTIEMRATRELPVRLEQKGDIARGYEASPAALVPYTTTLSGPASLVDSVSEVRASISVAGLKDDYNDTVNLLPVDSTGKTVTGIDLRPASIHVQILVAQKQGFRDVTVSPIITGQVASGYRLTNITVSPSVVTVSSPDPLKVNKLPGYIDTQPLDITGWNNDRTVRLPLTLPAGISLEGDQAVFVQVSIAAIEYSLTAPRPLELQGLGEGLEAVASPEKVDILISGPLPVLNELQQGDVRVFLDLTNLGEGTYQVTPRVNLLPAELRVEKVLTSPIEVIIRLKPTATPTATPTSTTTPTVTPTPTKTKKP